MLIRETLYTKTKNQSLVVNIYYVLEIVFWAKCKKIQDWYVNFFKMCCSHITKTSNPGGFFEAKTESIGSLTPFRNAQSTKSHVKGTSLFS